MEIDFTNLASPLDALNFGGWVCVKEFDAAPKLPVDPNRLPSIHRVYEATASTVDLRFNAKFRVKMASRRIRADVHPEDHLDCITVYGIECSRVEVFKFASPLIKEWGLFCYEVVGLVRGPNESWSNQIKCTKGIDELVAWLDDPMPTPGTYPFVANTPLSKDTQSFRMDIRPKATNCFSAEITCFWHRPWI